MNDKKPNDVVWNDDDDDDDYMYIQFTESLLLRSIQEAAMQKKPQASIGPAFVYNNNGHTKNI